MRLPQVRSDDRGSLPMVMLLITVGLGLSAVLGPLVVRQVVATRDSAARNAALDAAQAGMDMMMARVRAAAKPNAAGDKLDGQLEDLPACTITGDAGLDTAGTPMDYTVAITYRNESGGAMACPPMDVPTTAEMVVTGVSGKSTRRLTANYVFQTSNANIPGGQIKLIASSAGSDTCFDAGAAKVPAVDSLPTMQNCNGSSRQQFAYTPDLYLKLVNSESAANLDGMCMYAVTPHSVTSQIVFKGCPAPSVSPGKPNGLYQWSLDGFSQFHAVTSANVTEGNLCLTVNTPAPAAAGSTLRLGTCDRKWEYTMYRTAASVGAGMAGDTTAQLVNYEQFGRCLDFTDRDPNAGYMIVWYCKQDPDRVVESNQRWVHPIPVLPATSATGNIIVTKDEIDTTPYCLWSPLNTAANTYATVKPCAGNTLAANTQWTVFHKTESYATSYRIMDKNGYCLTPTDLDVAPLDTHWDGTAKVKVAVCNSSELQKWNAPPNIKTPTPLTGLIEK